MNAPTHHRPFNRAHAEAGAPYCCANGYDGHIIQWIGNEAIGYIRRQAHAVHAAKWDTNGVEDMAGVMDHAHDLVMTPLGMVDDRPVFVGDRLEQRDRHNVSWVARDVQPGDKDFSISRWPATVTASVLESSLTDAELIEAFGMDSKVANQITADHLRDVAVAVLERDRKDNAKPADRSLAEMMDELTPVIAANMRESQSLIKDVMAVYPDILGKKAGSAPAIQTSMSKKDLKRAFHGTDPNGIAGWHGIANAAIARAIADGQVVPK